VHVCPVCCACPPFRPLSVWLDLRMKIMGKHFDLFRKYIWNRVFQVYHIQICIICTGRFKNQSIFGTKFDWENIKTKPYLVRFVQNWPLACRAYATEGIMEDWNNAFNGILSFFIKKLVQFLNPLFHHSNMGVKIKLSFIYNNIRSL